MDVTVVIMTRNRIDELTRTLGHLTSLPGSPPIIVADNGSDDGTPSVVREHFPGVEVIELAGNLGVEARNIAVRQASTPYIAFNDDDSWWGPGSLQRVVDLFERHTRLGAVTAHVTVEPSGHDDPTSLQMQHSPLDGDPSVAGIPVLGFLACATAVRRQAFLDVGGFHPRFHFGGEEELLATDLRMADWHVRYVPDVHVHHDASTNRDPVWRARRGVRNTLWYLWLRRPLAAALRGSVQLLRRVENATAFPALLAALRGLPWVIRERRRVDDHLERHLLALEASQDAAGVRQYGA